MYKYILSLILGLSVFSVNAITVDPSIDSSKTLLCTKPVTREDGTPLTVGEIATITAHRSVDQNTWTVVGQDTECRYVENTTDLADGTYFYKFSATDTAGRESELSPEYETLVVKRVAPPGAPTNIYWE